LAGNCVKGRVAQQVVHTLVDVDGILIGFRFPAAASSVNVAGWHFIFSARIRRAAAMC
jgi:alpha-acetolactate decarboxylase